MRICTIFTICILILSSIISCSGTSDKKTESSDNAAVEGPGLASKRLIEVVGPADNASFKCSERILFSVTRAAGAENIDSVQLWVAGKRLTSLTSLPASAEILPTGIPGRISLRAVAFSSTSKPHTVNLFITLTSDVEPVIYRYRVVKDYPHDRGAYTQGLVYHEGYFIESTGQTGESSLRKVESETGKIISQLNLDPTLFGEGVAMLGERIYQLTWTTKVGFVYDRDSFTLLKKIYYQTQGWGLTNMGDSLVMSDGTNMLWFLDADFNAISSVEVWDNKGKVENLNELEMINGEVWANIWQTDRIARIEPHSGKVLGYVELGNLLPRELREPQTDVLNGIAWDRQHNRIFVTGKYWPKVYEITVTPQGRF